MLLFSLNFLLGISVFSLKNMLAISPLEWGGILGLIVLIFATFSRAKTAAISAVFFLLGFVWMGVFSAQVLGQKIDDIYLNKPIDVVGKIINLPEISAQKTKFRFEITAPFSAQVKLSWHGKPPIPLKTNDIWRLTLKLKRNNGYQNLGGFDYEQWLFYQQIDATGYVRTGKNGKNNHRIRAADSVSMDGIRRDIRQKIDPFLSKFEFGGVMNALIIGDRSLISPAHWDTFKNTNTTHLSVISGLHIGLISGFVFLLATWLWRQCPPCLRRTPAPIIGAVFGLTAALIYAVIAGLSIPTQRAFLMASVVFLSLIFRRHHSAWQLYGLALLLVLIINPLGVFSIGFWLSFYVVAVIIFAANRYKKRSWLVRLVAIQLIISGATLPLIAWFFAAGSVLSPIANLLAIPVFSLITTPLSLLGALFVQFSWVEVATLVFTIANQSLIWLDIFLQFLQNLTFNQWHYAQSSLMTVLILIAIVFIFLLPSALKLRNIALIMLLMVVIMPKEEIKTGQVLITVLDVGQGLAIVAKTQNHTLLFDTGAKYPSGFNLGEAVINPYLRAMRVQNLDKIIISHGDNDHIGGLNSVLNSYPNAQIITSVPAKISGKSVRCQTTKNWEWDGVLFEILNVNPAFKGNNGSCVLKISTDKFSTLLSADIEKKAERFLLKNHATNLKSTVLISPHHGSKTSSTEAFLTAVSPEIVLVSSGFKNRFKHPAKLVMARYRAHNIRTLNTACSGQISLLLGQTLRISEYRKTHASYYLRQCQSP